MALIESANVASHAETTHREKRAALRLERSPDSTALSASAKTMNIRDPATNPDPSRHLHQTHGGLTDLKPGFSSGFYAILIDFRH